MDIVDKYQELEVYFAAREVDLYAEARRTATAWVEDPGYRPDVECVENKDLIYVGAKPEWLDAPDIEEVQMRRFADVGDEL